MRSLLIVAAVALLAAAWVAVASGGEEEAPRPQPRGTVVVAVGDIACDPADPRLRDGEGTGRACRHAATARLARRLGPGAVLALGDLQYETGRLAAFRAVYHPTWGRLRRRTIPVLGNHEYLTPAARGYFDYWNGNGRKRGRAGTRGRGWQARGVGGWQLLGLNSNCDHVGCGRADPQLRWLRRRLARSRGRCTLAFMHHPRFSSGLHGDDPRLRALWRALYRGGAEAVVAGHEHSYERFAPLDPRGRLDRRRGLVQIVAGTGGQELRALGDPRPHSRRRSAAAFGVLRLVLEPGRLRWAFVATDGEVLDRGTRRCRA